MSIITKEIFVILNPRGDYVSFYESKGYIIPRVCGSVKRGTSILVKVHDLQPNSHIKVLCKCDKCGKERLLSFKKVKPFCKKCALSTDEFKEKIRKIRIGTKASPEAIIKMKNSNHPCWFPQGKNHPNFNHQLSELERKIGRNRSILKGYYQWQQSILNKDNYTCQKCGSKANLQVHHINNFATFKDQRLLVENGITFCKECHKSIHTKFGIFTTRKDFNNFMH